MTSEPKPQTVLEYLTTTARFFKDRGLESSRLEAELLLAHALGCDRVQLYVRYDMVLKEAEVDRFRELVKRRGKEPVHYILGRREFWSLDFEVEPGVLIPRPDTEVIIEEVLAFLKLRKDEQLVIADVGTGSGCLAVTLAHELPQAKVVAGDIADIPLAVARKNAERLGVGTRVEVVRANGLAPLAAAYGPFDVVVSNPPYIRTAEYPGLPPQVRREPKEALEAGVDGLDVLRPIASALPGAVRPGGLVVLEIGDSAQAQDVIGLLAAVGYADARIRNDYAGDARAVVARAPETK